MAAITSRVIRSPDYNWLVSIERRLVFVLLVGCQSFGLSVFALSHIASSSVYRNGRDSVGSYLHAFQ